MKRSGLRRWLALGALLVLGGLAFGLERTALAAEQNATGITVSPAFQNIDILPGQASTSQSFSIANNDDVPVAFSLTAVDMGSLDDTGGVVFSGLPAGYADNYGIAKWVTLPQRTIVIPPRTTRTVNFIITSDDTLRDGGHYGAIIINAQDAAQTVENQIKFDPQTATLLFIRKIGREVFGLRLEQPVPVNALWRLPDNLTLRMKNEGNVHIVPRGVLKITGPGGRVAKQGIINSESSLVLPERSRNYQVKLQDFGWWRLPGRYKIDVAYRYDGLNQFMIAEQSFFFWNLPLLLMSAAVLAILILAERIIDRRYGKVIRRKYAAVTDKVESFFHKIKQWPVLRRRPGRENLPAQTKSYVFWPTHKRGRPTEPPAERPKSHIKK